MTRYLFCKVIPWNPKNGELPPTGATITNGMLHQPIKAFRTREGAQKFATEQVLKSNQYFIPDITEIELDDASRKVLI